MPKYLKLMDKTNNSSLIQEYMTKYILKMVNKETNEHSVPVNKTDKLKKLSKTYTSTCKKGVTFVAGLKNSNAPRKQTPMKGVTTTAKNVLNYRNIGRVVKRNGKKIRIIPKCYWKLREYPIFKPCRRCKKSTTNCPWYEPIKENDKKEIKPLKHK